MSKRYLSDQSGTSLSERDATILKVSKNSPLRERFGAEVHLSHKEAAALADIIDPPKPPKKPKGAA
jgi:hypothetical protein